MSLYRNSQSGLLVPKDSYKFQKFLSLLTLGSTVLGIVYAFVWVGDCTRNDRRTCAKEQEEYKKEEKQVEQR